MPYLNGKLVSLAKWREANPLRVFVPGADQSDGGPAAATPEPVVSAPDEPVKARRTRTPAKAAAASAAAKAATGVALALNATVERDLPPGITLADGEKTKPPVAQKGTVSAHLLDADLDDDEVAGHDEDIGNNDAQEEAE